MIQPRILKGFRDFLPEAMINKKELIRRLETIFEMYGFVPIDTPALEYTEILLSKGGGETDKQMYRFEDHGKRDVALRFDLTVPLARFVSQNFNDLTFPFKRYHIAPVWRGEKNQKGRYREFYQCDFDIIGTSEALSDLEILLLVHDGLESIGAGDFQIEVNNRTVLRALMSALFLDEKSADILRALDKIYKIGRDEVARELTDGLGIPAAKTDRILNAVAANETHGFKGEDIFAVCDSLEKEFGDGMREAVIDIRTLFKGFDKLGIAKRFSFNPVITRGLDYYTGTVFESFITSKREYGSICSGGRYDNLTGLYMKESVSGIGGSFGLDRILALMEEEELVARKSSTSKVLIFRMDNDAQHDYMLLARKLRAEGIACEIFFEKKKIGLQFKFAEKKGIPYVIIAGKDELSTGTYNIKNIISGNELRDTDMESVISMIKGNR